MLLPNIILIRIPFQRGQRMTRELPKGFNIDAIRLIKPPSCSDALVQFEAIDLARGSHRTAEIPVEIFNSLIAFPIITKHIAAEFSVPPPMIYIYDRTPPPSIHSEDQEFFDLWMIGQHG